MKTGNLNSFLAFIFLISGTQVLALDQLGYSPLEMQLYNAKSWASVLRASDLSLTRMTEATMVPESTLPIHTEYKETLELIERLEVELGITIQEPAKDAAPGCG